MTQPILTDAEMHALISGNPFTLGLSIARLKDFIRQVEKAVVAKLAEQEPVAWRVWLDDLQCWSCSCDYHGCGEPLYAHPMPSSQVNLDSSNAPFTPKTASEMRSFIGMHFDSLQYANPETEEPDEMDRYTLTVHDLLSAFDWAGHYDCDHISDDGKMVVPDGWQLVPKTPTNSMIDNAHNCESYFEVQDIYKAMLAAAPKFGEEE